MSLSNFDISWQNTKQVHTALPTSKPTHATFCFDQQALQLKKKTKCFNEVVRRRKEKSSWDLRDKFADIKTGFENQSAIAGKTEHRYSGAVSPNGQCAAVLYHSLLLLIFFGKKQSNTRARK